MQGESKYIRKDRIAAIFIPGLIQYQNDQKEKTVIFLFWTLGLMASWFWYLDDPNNYIILLLAGLAYLYSILDSLIIFLGLKRKRTSISEDAEKYYKNSHGKTKKTYYFSSIEKGEKFEKFVVNKFDPKNFGLFKMTAPFHGVSPHYNENNLDPDFILRYIPTRERFAVEAKYRSSCNNSGNIEWCKEYQFPRYKRFEYEEKIPVYIVIGLGGIPDDPDKMFVVPLEFVESHKLELESLSKYQMNPNNNFMWQPGGFWNSGRLYQMAVKPPNPQ